MEEESGDKEKKEQEEEQQVEVQDEVENVEGDGEQVDVVEQLETEQKDQEQEDLERQTVEVREEETTDVVQVPATEAPPDSSLEHTGLEILEISHTTAVAFSQKREQVRRPDRSKRNAPASARNRCIMTNSGALCRMCTECKLIFAKQTNIVIVLRPLHTLWAGI